MSTQMSRDEAENLTVKIKASFDAMRADIRALEEMGALVEAAQAQTQLDSMLAMIGGEAR